MLVSQSLAVKSPENPKDNNRGLMVCLAVASQQLPTGSLVLLIIVTACCHRLQTIFFPLTSPSEVWTPDLSLHIHDSPQIWLSSETLPPLQTHLGQIPG